METDIKKKRQVDAKEFLCVGRFYWTTAGFPKELDRSKDEYTKSPLRSFQTLLPLELLISERQLLRESTDTTIIHKKPQGGKTRGKKQYNYRRPCYLAKYDKSTNEGVIFLGTSKEPGHPHRFAIVHSRPPVKPLLPGSLGTIPPYSFREEKTYLNFSHPLRVRFAYFPNDRFRHIENDEIPCDGCEPPFVAIANFATQPTDDGPKESSIVFDPKSEDLFWEKHMEYHRNRLGQLVSKDDNGGAEPDDGGSSLGGAGPSTGGAEPSTGGAGPNTGGAGPSTGGAGPSKGGAQQSTRWNTSGTGWSLGSVGSNRVDFSSCKAEDAPWGRVGDQHIGIDIPLVIEDICSDSDEEMCLEEPMINYDAIDAPWGRVGNQRIGIDIPLVTEDICSDSDEEMDSESVGKLQEVDDIANVVELESSGQEGITIGPNPSDKNSSLSYLLSKPYFVILSPHQHPYGLLDYNHLVGKWRWNERYIMTGNTTTISIEGLSYELPLLNSGHKYNGQSEPIRRIFNWHTKNVIWLPPDGHLILSDVIVGMIVDTSVRPYAFKVIEGTDRGTLIFDSMTNQWTRRLSVRPQLNIHRSFGNANVASCKGVAFIISGINQIVLYDTEKDKWDHVWNPKEHVDGWLCGIGSWDDRIFSSIHCKSGTVQVRELVDMANREWRNFDAMPREMYAWLITQEKFHRRLRINISYCSENLLIWATTKRFVLCNLARKTWEKLELPLDIMEFFLD